MLRMLLLNLTLIISTVVAVSLLPHTSVAADATDASTNPDISALMDFYQNNMFPQDSTANMDLDGQNQGMDSQAELPTDPYGLDSVDLDFHAIDDILGSFNNACDRVAQQVGETVFNLVTPRLLEGPQDILKACPQWPKISEHDRRDFYIALVTAMALAESSCNNNARARGTTGTAYGLWQGTRPRSPIEGARWVMKQLDSQVAQSGLLFWGNKTRNYWALLNPQIHAYKVQAMLRKIPRCFVQGLVNSRNALQSAVSRNQTKSASTLKDIVKVNQLTTSSSNSTSKSGSLTSSSKAQVKGQKRVSRKPIYKKYRVYHRYPRPHWHWRYKRIN